MRTGRDRRKSAYSCNRHDTATGIRVRSESAGSMANCLRWGFEVASRRSPNTLIRHRGPPSHWRTLLRNHAIGEIAPTKLSTYPDQSELFYTDSEKFWGQSHRVSGALPRFPQTPKRLRQCVCVRVCELGDPRRGYIAGVFLCK